MSITEIQTEEETQYLHDAITDLLMTKIANLVFLSIDSKADADVEFNLFKREERAGSLKYYTLEENSQFCFVRIRIESKNGNKYLLEVTEVDATGDISIYPEHLEIQ